MKTLKEQLSDYKTYYIQPLRPKSNSLTEYFQIYYIDDNGKLEAFWPFDSENYKSAQAQEINKKISYNYYKIVDCYAFRLTGGNYSKPYEIKTLIQSFNKDADVLLINLGRSPSSSM